MRTSCRCVSALVWDFGLCCHGAFRVTASCDRGRLLPSSARRGAAQGVTRCAGSRPLCAVLLFMSRHSSSGLCPISPVKLLRIQRTRLFLARQAAVPSLLGASCAGDAATRASRLACRCFDTALLCGRTVRFVRRITAGLESKEGRSRRALV
jgi:hypothetical protein